MIQYIQTRVVSYNLIVLVFIIQSCAIQYYIQTRLVSYNLKTKIICVFNMELCETVETVLYSKSFSFVYFICMDVSNIEQDVKINSNFSFVTN